MLVIEPSTYTRTSSSAHSTRREAILCEEHGRRYADFECPCWTSTPAFTAKVKAWAATLDARAMGAAA